MFTSFLLSGMVLVAADVEVTMVSQNVASGNLSPFEYNNNENKKIVGEIVKEMQSFTFSQLFTEDVFQELICAVDANSDGKLMGVTSQEIKDATEKLLGEKVTGEDVKKITSGKISEGNTCFTANFFDYFSMKKLEGDDVLTTRPALTMDAISLEEELKRKNFAEIFVSYLNARKAKDFLTSNDTKKNSTIEQPSNELLAQRIVTLFMYDYSILVATKKTESFGLDSYWLAEKSRLDFLMKKATDIAISSILSLNVDFIALQEANIEGVTKAFGVHNERGKAAADAGGLVEEVEYAEVNYTKKEKSSIILYNKKKFTIVSTTDLDKFNQGKGEAVCATFKSVSDKSKQVYVCSYHADSDGLRTLEFLAEVHKYTGHYVLVGMDGNVNANDKYKKNSLVLEKIGVPSFTAAVELANLEITYKDFVKHELFVTTSKNRSSVQSQQSKANKPDKNPKDHILTRNIDGKMVIFNKCEIQDDSTTKFTYEEGLDMPNINFAGDHALLQFSGTLNETPEVIVHQHK